MNTINYSVPIFTVPSVQPTVRVRLVSRRHEPSLQAAWRAVPLPLDAHPAAGTDGQLVVWQPSTDRLWEFWQLADAPDGWQANWGGAIRDVSSSPGFYGPKAWPRATGTWGASASSLSIAGGLITLEDLELGQIDHALAMAIPDVRAGVYATPAETHRRHVHQPAGASRGSTPTTRPNARSGRAASPTIHAHARRSRPALRNRSQGHGLARNAIRARSDAHRHEPVHRPTRLLRGGVASAALGCLPLESLAGSLDEPAPSRPAKVRAVNRQEPSRTTAHPHQRRHGRPPPGDARTGRAARR